MFFKCFLYYKSFQKQGKNKQIQNVIWPYLKFWHSYPAYSIKNWRTLKEARMPLSQSQLTDWESKYEVSWIYTSLGYLIARCLLCLSSPYVTFWITLRQGQALYSHAVILSLIGEMSRATCSVVAGMAASALLPLLRSGCTTSPFHFLAVGARGCGMRCCKAALVGWRHRAEAGGATSARL